MSLKFSLENPMPPIWMMYPEISQYSIGWRMGYGESYKWKWTDWFGSLTEQEQKKYGEMFPQPIFWREYDGVGDENIHIKDFEIGLVQHWNKNGAEKYSLDNLLNQPDRCEWQYLFFWKPNAGAVDKSCLGQWQPSVFEVDACRYTCAEQYMMAEKARIFEDEEIEEQIMQATDPKIMKALGKKVKGFNQTTWDKAKYSIVLNGNYYKFTQNANMRAFLLSTGDKILVEASPLDTIWGIGLSEDNVKAQHPNTWRGKNLLGFALMEVRDELKRIYQNFDKIDWKQFENGIA